MEYIFLAHFGAGKTFEHGSLLIINLNQFFRIAYE